MCVNRLKMYPSRVAYFLLLGCDICTSDKIGNEIVEMFFSFIITSSSSNSSRTSSIKVF